MKIHSTFLSIDGEVNHWGQGIPSVFIRLQGCNLRCKFCDALDAQDNRDDNMTVQQVFELIRSYECPKITITGGEPLLQFDEVSELCNRLFPYNYAISVETNGTISTARFRDRIRPYDRLSLVVDYKLDNQEHMNQAAFSHLTEMDWVKFVIRNKEGYSQAKEIMKINKYLGCRAKIAFSPIHDELPGGILAKWILKDKLWNVTLNVQIHKFLGLE